MNAMNILAKSLNRRAGDFYFSGTKDKRGDTVQKIVAKGISKREMTEKLLDEKNWSFSNILVSNLKEVNQMTKLGDLYGNRFSIALRLTSSSSENEIE